MPKVNYIGTPDLGALLLGMAERQGVTDSEIAIQLGVTRQTYTNWKKDPLRSMSFNSVIKLCKYLGLSLEDFAATIPLKGGERNV